MLFCTARDPTLSEELLSLEYVEPKQKRLFLQRAWIITPYSLSCAHFDPLAAAWPSLSHYYAHRYVVLHGIYP